MRRLRGKGERTRSAANPGTHRRRLLELARRLQGDTDGLTAEACHAIGGDAGGSASSLPMHLADLGTDAADQRLTLALLENGSRTLGEIVVALTRLEEGRFGVCE